MPDPERAGGGGADKKELVVSLGNVLAGLKESDFLEKDSSKFAVAIRLMSNEQPSTLMLPNIGGGKTEAFLTKPIKISFEHLEKYLKTKEVELPKEVKGVLKAGYVACEAFYYQKDGPMLMMFEGGFGADEEEIKKKEAEIEKLRRENAEAKEIKDKEDDLRKQKGGLIGALSGDSELSELFDIKGISVRVVKCKKADFKVLQDYAKALEG